MRSLGWPENEIRRRDVSDRNDRNASVRDRYATLLHVHEPVRLRSPCNEVTRSPQSTKDLEEEAARESQEAENNLVTFFESLDEKSLAEYRTLAQRDLRFGEDLTAERAALTPKASRD
jgi:hypothetical protein